MDGGHEPLADAEGVVQDLDDGGQAVGGAGGVGDDVVPAGVVLGVVDAEDDCEVFAFGGGADDDLLGAAAVDVGAGLLCGGEQPRGLDHDLDAEVFPRDLGGIALGEHLDGLPIDGDGVVAGGDVAREDAVVAIVLEEVCVGGRAGEVVHGDDLEPI